MSTLVSVSSRINADFAAEVRDGLTRKGQKELHSKYLYDELGSALFEAITLVPEYGLTRADDRILATYAEQIVDRCHSPSLVAELGSGTGRKTRHLLECIPGARYCPIDVSASALERCARDLGSIAEVQPVLDSYLPGVARVTATRTKSEPVLVLFLGSTIGNFEREPALEFLRGLRDQLLPGDYLLLGADLLKPVEQLLIAYDDPAGVTAAFNLNLLARVNRELGANFDLRSFHHESRFDPRHRRIEMHLRATRKQQVTIPAADCTIDLAYGETIWTESSHKYELPELTAMAERSGFATVAEWVDEEWPFVESLWIAK